LKIRRRRRRIWESTKRKKKRMGLWFFWVEKEDSKDE